LRTSTRSKLWLESTGFVERDFRLQASGLGEKAAHEELQFLSFPPVHRQELQAEPFRVRASHHGGIHEYGALIVKNIQLKSDDASRRQLGVRLDATPGHRNLYDGPFGVDLIPPDKRREATGYTLVFAAIEEYLRVTDPGLSKLEAMRAELAAKRIDIKNAR
jgi:hypothetical protein